MFDRFADQARQVIVLAREEAVALGHGHVGTEHILLGVLRSGDPSAGRALEGLGLTATRVRSQILRLVGEGDEHVPGKIPFTPRAKAALELAQRETPPGENVEPRHLLLGIAGEGRGVGARILREADADLEEMRRELGG